MFQLPIIAVILGPQYYISKEPYCHILLNQLAASVFNGFSLMFLELTMDSLNLLGIYILNVIYIPCSCLPHTYLLYYINSELVTLLKVIEAPIQVPDIFYLTVSFKFINFSFQTFLLFVPEMSASFMSDIVHIIYIALAWIPF
jgi:hypothetical protein